MFEQTEKERKRRLSGHGVGEMEWQVEGNRVEYRARGHTVILPHY